MAMSSYLDLLKCFVSLMIMKDINIMRKGDRMGESRNCIAQCKLIA